MVERHCDWVLDCARHGVSCMVMHVTQGRAVPVPVAEGVDSLRRIVAVAEAHGVIVAIENTHCPQHVTALLKAIDSPHLGLCYDISHDVLHSPVPFALLWRWHHRVAALHLNDTDGRLDRHWLPGEGVINYEALAGLIPSGPALMLEAVPKDRSESAPSFLGRAFDCGFRIADCGTRRDGLWQGPLVAGGTWT
jgi:sugar phosphate isomerase/epimerase